MHLSSLTIKSKGKLPLKILKPLVAWKKSKSDNLLPTKLEPLIALWEKAKDQCNLYFKSFLKETSVFDAYKINRTTTDNGYCHCSTDQSTNK